ncbi:IS110 family transposase [Spongiibacter sp. KMU-166]|uniref:IS110 family transposase n=1 Tax=Spongiibacter thalassae TaxID=2721624 RepID=A0ABX1GET8_9GAMM|nr:IS110 family transposase [Spongiibacter thalassae]NKI17702.1 IS110 family transposase [Spongiibacter thalassae]
MSDIVRCGLDIAKHVMAVHGVDSNGNVVVRKNLSRKKVLEYFAQIPPCCVGIESCGGSHYWARELIKLGHTPRLISVKFVIPYRRKGKNDANDAEAICEAISRPGMRFLSVKTEDQQSILMAHRIRTQSIATRTALINQIHGHLQEFGIVVSKGRHKLKRDLVEIFSDESLPTLLHEMLHDLLAALLREEERIETLDKRIGSWVEGNETASRLTKLDGIGPITASAVVATTGHASSFKNGRQFAAWLGLVPRQYSSGGKNKLGRITKQGDRYLRTLLIHGARTVLLMSSRGRGDHREWIESLRSRKPDNVVAVAYAAKQARMLWAIMAEKPSPLAV